jgi:glutamyl-tRNA reductase
VEFRERVSFTPEQAVHAAGELRKQGILEEAVVLSTCNRSELYGVPNETGPAVAEAMEMFFTTFHQIPRAELDGRLYRWMGADAVRHLFRVAAGIDSMMLGEAEILGQLRTAYNQALDHGSTGPVLNRMFQGALEVGKRVRAETEVGARPMSVALAGVKLAERVFGNLKGHSALIVGAGAVAEQVVEHLRNRGIGSVRVVNRSYEHAAELARKMGGEAVAWESLEAVVGVPDILVTSVAGTGPVLTREMLERAIAARNGRPVFVVDLGVPRNVSADAAGLYNLYLYDIDDLGEIVEQNKKSREAEIPRAEALISEHLAKFEAWRAAIEAGSIVDDLRDRFHKHREMLIREKLAEMKDVSPEERERIAHITEELIERVLEHPTQKMRQGGKMRGHLAGLDALRHLFGLDEEKD